MNSNATAENVIDKLTEILDSIAFECDGKADVDDTEDGVTPNFAMRVQIEAENGLDVITRWRLSNGFRSI